MTAVKYSHTLVKKTMVALISKFVAVTGAPLDFFDFVKDQDEALYERIADLIVFEEVANGNFRLQKLYQPDIWDGNTEFTLDVIWCRYCGLFP